MEIILNSNHSYERSLMTEETNNQRISRERRKFLLNRLKSQVGPHKRDLYIAAVLSWVQFLMRILSFFLIAKNVEYLYKGQAVVIPIFISLSFTDFLLLHIEQIISSRLIIYFVNSNFRNIIVVFYMIILISIYVLHLFVPNQNISAMSKRFLKCKLR